MASFPIARQLGLFLGITLLLGSLVFVEPTYRLEDEQECWRCDYVAKDTGGANPGRCNEMAGVRPCSKRSQDCLTMHYQIDKYQAGMGFCLEDYRIQCIEEWTKGKVILFPRRGRIPPPSNCPSQRVHWKVWKSILRFCFGNGKAQISGIRWNTTLVHFCACKGKLCNSDVSGQYNKNHLGSITPSVESGGGNWGTKKLVNSKTEVNSMN